MGDFNKWVFTGNLVKDPEAKETRGGKPYTNIRVAFNRGWGDREQTDFVSVLCYGKLGEYVLANGAKGKKVLVEAELSIMLKDNSTSVFATAVSVRFMTNGNGNGTKQETTPAAQEDERFPREVYQAAVQVQEDESEPPLPF
jgi:single stranded DNA-binding protein